MVVLAFIAFSIVLSCRAHLVKRGSQPEVGKAAVPADAAADRVQNRWTSLDDRQLTRLLDDNAPC